MRISNKILLAKATSFLLVFRRDDPTEAASCHVNSAIQVRPSLSNILGSTKFDPWHLPAYSNSLSTGMGIATANTHRLRNRTPSPMLVGLDMRGNECMNGSRSISRVAIESFSSFGPPALKTTLSYCSIGNVCYGLGFRAERLNPM